MQKALLLFVAFLFFGTSCTGNKLMITKDNLGEVKAKARLTTVFFPADSDLWTGQILSGFYREILKSEVSLSLNSAAYQFGLTTDEELLENIAATKPDYVFLPDDFLYKKFAKKINEKTGAFIVFTTFYSKEKNLQETSEQAGIVCSAPIKSLLEKAAELSHRDVKAVSLVGGPFSEEMASYIKSKVPSNITFSTFITSSWEEYTRISKEKSQEGELIFALAPFGIKSKDNKPVSDKVFKELMGSLETLSLGYGGIKGYSRDVSMAISPKTLGQNAANLLNEILLKGKKKVLREYKDYDLTINQSSLKKLDFSLSSSL